jgi:hypothetical protein
MPRATAGCIVLTSPFSEANDTSTERNYQSENLLKITTHAASNLLKMLRTAGDRSAYAHVRTVRAGILC